MEILLTMIDHAQETLKIFDNISPEDVDRLLNAPPELKKIMSLKNAAITIQKRVQCEIDGLQLRQRFSTHDTEEYIVYLQSHIDIYAGLSQYLQTAIDAYTQKINNG